MRNIKFKTKITLVFLSAYTTISIYLIFQFYNSSVAVQKERLREKLMQFSDLGTNLIDAEMIKAIPAEGRSMEKKPYKDLVECLRIIMKVDPEISDVYILIPTMRPGTMLFLANADPEEILICGEPFDISFYPELRKAFDAPTADHEITEDKWGYWLSGYAPVKGSDGKVLGILGVDISARTISEMRAKVRNSAWFAFIIGIIASLAAGNLASWWLTKPINSLISGMEKIRLGELDQKIPVVTSDEIGILARNFNLMAEELKDYIDRLTRTTREKERLKRDLEIAAELQRSMLPVAQLNISDLDLAGFSLPALQVGGDYFDYIDRDGQNIGFVIADASGKGLPGSIFMTNSRSIFKVMATEEISPSRVMERTNEIIIKEVNVSGSMFVTMFYGIYDRKEKVFRYSNAGHNPPILVDSSSPVVSYLGPHGTPVGVLEDQRYGESEIRMKKGDMIVLYTDGVVEAMNTKKEMFGLERLKTLVLANKDLSSGAIMEKIKEKVFDFTGEEAQFDDLTLLIFKIL